MSDHKSTALTVTNDVYKMDVQQLTEFANELVKSELTPFKKVADIITVAQYGKDLGIPFAMAMSGIFPVNGKATLSMHVVTALLIRGGVKIEVVSDYEEIYYYVSSLGFIKAYTVKELEDMYATGKYQFVTDKTNPADYKEGKIRLLRRDAPNLAVGYVDRITKIKMTRPELGLEFIGEYKLSDAAAAGLLSKDVWIKNPASMLYARTLTKVGRRIGADLLHLPYEKTELQDNPTEVPIVDTIDLEDTDVEICE